MYGMHRTTIYLPDDLKAALDRTAVAEGRSASDLIRDGVRLVTRSDPGPQLDLPLFRSGDPQLAEQVDEALEGFGER